MIFHLPAQNTIKYRPVSSVGAPVFPIQHKVITAQHVSNNLDKYTPTWPRVRTICACIYNTTNRNLQHVLAYYRQLYVYGQPEKSFLNLVKLNRNRIVFTIFWLIWRQTEVRWVPNQSENCKYNLISVWFNKIPKRFLYVHSRNSCTVELILSKRLLKRIAFDHCHNTNIMTRIVSYPSKIPLERSSHAEWKKCLKSRLKYYDRKIKIKIFGWGHMPPGGKFCLQDPFAILR